MKTNLVIIVLSFIVVCLFITPVLLCSSDMTDLDSQQSQINSLQSEIAKKENITIVSKTVKISDDGYDVSRVNRDKDIAEKMFKNIHSWDSYDEYMKARQSLIDDYGIKKDSKFLKTFMPEPEVIHRIDGSDWNNIDGQKLNSTFDGVDIICDKINNDVYYYAAIVHWTVYDDKNENGGKADTETVYTYGVDKSGKVSDFQGYTVT